MNDSADPFPDFAFAVGEEGSDPIVDRDGQRWRHDQFRDSGHYERMQQDLADVAGLGVHLYRYGMPWRLTEQEPGRYDWSLWDRALAGCEAAGLEPIVDLLHFGLPDHYKGFLDPSWVDGFARYVDAFLARYPSPRFFTPVNEPGITALMSGLIGFWNDEQKSRASWTQILAHVSLANLEAMARVRADRAGWWIGAEGFGLPVAGGEATEQDVADWRAQAWLIWDLQLGVAPQPSAAPLLDVVPTAVRDRIAALATRQGLIAGHDVYPTAITPVGGPGHELDMDARLDLYLEEARRWHDRYAVPFWLGETSNLSLPTADAIPWLQGMHARLQTLREEGRPVRGLCWYSRGDQYDWQTGLINPTGAVTEVGLFDAARKPRPVAAEFARLARGG